MSTPETINPKLHAGTFLETPIELWKVRGLYGQVFASKESAEIAARYAFPDEDIYLRMARIHYVLLSGTCGHLAELAKHILGAFDVKR